MSNTQVLKIRVPLELKERLEKEAKHQGTTLDLLTSYLLTTHLTQLETISSLELKLSKRSLPDLKRKVENILKKVPERQVPEWDSIQ